MLSKRRTIFKAFFEVSEESSSAHLCGKAAFSQWRTREREREIGKRHRACCEATKRIDELSMRFISTAIRTIATALCATWLAFN